MKTTRRQIAGALLGSVFIAAACAAEAVPQPEPKEEMETIRPEIFDRLLAGAASRAVADDLAQTARERLRALEREHGSEALFTHSQSRSHVENIQRDWLACRIPLAGRWRLAAVAKREFYGINFPDSGETIAADLTRLEVRGEWVRDRNLNLALGLEPYSGSADGLAAHAALQFAFAEDWQIACEGFGHRPWDDSTYAIANSAYRNGSSFAVSGRPLPRLWCLATCDVAEYEAADASGESDGGWSRAFGLRGYMTIWRQPRQTAGEGFLDPAARGDEALESSLHLYAAGRWFEHQAPDDFIAVPYIPASRDRRIGIEWRQAVARHMGWLIAAYVGEDDERLIPWRSLYGCQAKIFLVVGDRSRLWAGWEMNSESGTAVGGRTAVITWGMNMDF